MTMNNYLAWSLRPDGFENITSLDEKIKYILQFGILAPSMHNTQPWMIKIEKNVAVIMPDHALELPHGDYNRRGYYFSLGCFIYNVKIAASHFGFKVLSQESKDFDVVKLTFEKGKKAESTLLEGVVKRCTNRLEYEKKPLPATVTEVCKKVESKGLRTFILEGNKKDAFAELVGKGSGEALGSQNFRKELSKWSKPFNTRSYRGMPLTVLGFPKLLTLILPYVLPFINPKNKVTAKDTNLVLEKTAHMLLIATQDDSHASWVKTGMAFEEISVVAAVNGIFLHPLYGTVFSNKLREIVQKEYTQNLLPQFVARIGSPTKLSLHTPRLNIYNNNHVV